MRTLSKFAAAVAIGTAALVGSAQASTITVTNGAGAQLLNQSTATESYSFNYAGGLLKLLLADTSPDYASVQYKLYTTGLTATLQDVNVSGTEPSVSWALAAGSYVLEIINLPGTLFSQTQISAVPVPGAALLFATTALGFFGLNKRRKG